MFEIKRSHLIAATAAPLAVALFAAAIVVSRGPSPAPPKSDVDVADAPKKNDAAPESSSTTKRAAKGATKTLAVSASGFDRISKSLDKLGAGFQYEMIEDETLVDAAALHRYQAVFLTCTDAKGAPPEDLAKVLRVYVNNGGTLYTSDLRFDVVAAAFPELVDPASVAQGVPQDVQALVISPELRDVLGPEILLHIKSDRWRPAAFKGDDVSVLLKGSLKTTAGPSIDAPLAVRFPVGKGTVIFTSFHSEGRVSDVEAKLLEFLAVKTLTSAPEARLTESLADAGLTVRAVRAVALDAGDTPKYHDTELTSTGPVSFRLEPVRPGALLHLEVVDPTGKTTSKKGDKALAIDLPDAASGRWRFCATAESAPYPSFQAVIVVGSAGDAPDTKTGRMTPGLVKAGNVRFEEIILVDKNAVEESRPLRIAVTEPRFDDMGKLLNALGDGYRHTQIDDEDLLNPPALDRYDVLFLTCGGWPAKWGTTTSVESVRPGLARGSMRPENIEKIKRTLNRLVDRGGTLYVSDLRMDLLSYAFPDRVPPPDLDVKNLAAVAIAEKNWLKVVAPLVEAWNVPRTLGGVKLTEKLLARREELIAALYTSTIVSPNSTASHDEDLKTVQSRTAMYGLPATKLDCELIARAFQRRRVAISDSVQSRNRAKINAMHRHINTAAEAMGEQISRLQVAYDGAAGQFVEAQVVDSGLEEAIGETIRLRFPDNAWRPCRFEGQDVQILMRGSYQSVRHEQIEAPLLVKFRQGKGTVIFTSFHNEAQNSQQEQQLLRYLVFSAVTAKQEALAQETMLSGGFSPVRQGQVNHAVGLDSITKRYQSTSGEPLRFSLNFGGNGATLRLTLVAPGGSTHERETDETLLVEATGAPAGEWLYTVTAVKVPYQNFAYSVSIGKVNTDAPWSKR